MRPIRSVAAATAVSRVTGSKTVVTLCSTRCPTARPSARKTASSLPRSAMRARSWKCVASKTRRASVRGCRQAASWCPTPMRKALRCICRRGCVMVSPVRTGGADGSGASGAPAGEAPFQGGQDLVEEQAHHCDRDDSRVHVGDLEVELGGVDEVTEAGTGPDHLGGDEDQ